MAEVDILPIESHTDRIQLTIPVIWSYVSSVRQMIEEAVSHRAPSLRAAASLVASELVENAIKYGEPVAVASEARFNFTISDVEVIIEVSNGLRAGPVAQDLMQRISRIAASENKEQLCLERMQELISQPHQHGQLGLYRITSEAGFELSCTYKDEVLVMRAKRAL